MSRPLGWSFSVVQLLELYSAYFGRYCRNMLSFTALQMYPWHLKMVYYTVDILLKMVSCKVMTIENEMLKIVKWYQCYLHISWYEILYFGIWCSVVVFQWSMVNWGGLSVLGISAFYYMWNLFGVVVFHGSRINWLGSPSALGICAFCYMFNLFGVVVLHGPMADWLGGPSSLGICAFCYMFNIFGVVLLHGPTVNCRGIICLGYMCIVLYMKLIWCNGFPEISDQL